MKLDTARRICQAMDEIVKRGERFQWSGLTHIASVSKVCRQTVWRYLEKMEREKLVYKVERTWRGETAYRYYMTNEGKKFLKSFRKLEGMED